MKTTKIILIILFLAVLGFIAYRSFVKTQTADYKTTFLQKRNIRETIFIPGNVFPAKEIELKSQLSGILENVFVKIGDNIVTGTPVASIKLAPTASDIERLESNVKLAQIEYETRASEYKRAGRLFATQTISQAEIEEYTRLYNLAGENLVSARNQLDIMKEGRVVSKNISNIVTSSTAGTVIDIPLETGASVIERNNYNPGTTVAVIAETAIFRFRTPIIEHYLKYVASGDTVTLTLNACNDFTVKATVTKISSKGNPENGIMKYMLDAEFPIQPDMPDIRSGYSATAEILLKSSNNTPSIEEKYLVYNNDSTYLYISDKQSGKPVRQPVTTGISDGIYTEITDSISSDTEIVTNYVKTD
ncbi:MAG: efflux RND transporter periplasmic adaptor subunit [Dysgonamonadaceae bacterium]|jgi:HlyD family secretion protein|nr:efflux RND transporter periplasmic adaptor subunit [Dysgonamonadaceae bacterium]